MVKINRGHVFWAIWAVVVGAAAAFYYLEVAPKFEENQKKLGAYEEAVKKLRPMSLNKSKIPSKEWEKSERRKGDILLAERDKFVKEAFPAVQFAVNEKDFSPPPPPEPERFREWLLFEPHGQDLKIDAEFRKLVGNREMIRFQAGLVSSAPGAPAAWLSDGRCGGFRAGDDREKILRRLVLRRLILRAIVRTRAETRAFDAAAEDEKSKSSQPITDVPARSQARGVEWIERIAFLDEAEISMAALAAGGAPPPGPVPYRVQGLELDVHCHLSVVPALIRELERIGEVEKRPFAFWVDRLLIQRLPGKPDWAPGAKQPLDLPVNYGDRYIEWPVSVRICGTLPVFNPDALDPAPVVK